MKKIRKVLILGASSDIGIEVVNLFLKNNWKVVAHFSNNKKKLQIIDNQNLELVRFKFENLINIEKKIEKFFDNNFDSFVNLVGYIDGFNFFKTNSNTIIKSLTINTLMPFLIYKLLLKKMISNKFGRIVNCSSIGVKFGGGVNTYSYSLSKHCLEFIPGIYKNWAKNNVLINNVRIGVTNTKIHKKIKNKDLKQRTKLIPIGRMAEPKEVAISIFNMGSENNTLVTGETITVAGGE